MREMKQETDMEDEHPFLLNYDRSELRIAAEFLTTWLPFLTKNLCQRCSKTLSNRVLSLDPDFSGGTQPLALKEIQCDCHSDTNSLGSWKERAIGCSPNCVSSLDPDFSGETSPLPLKEIQCDYHSDTNSLGSWKDSAIGCLPNDFTNHVSSPGPDLSGGAQPLAFKEIQCDNLSDTNSPSSWKDDAIVWSPKTLTNHVYALNTYFCGESQPVALKEIDCDCHSDANSLGSWKGGVIECSPYVPDANILVIDSPGSQVSWTDMEEDDLLDEDEDNDISGAAAMQHVLSEDPKSKVQKKNSPLSRKQQEYHRFNIIKRKKDFICLEKFRGIRINILHGLEMHTGVFNAAEQKRIVDFIYTLEEKGRKGELKERTFSAPVKWMPGKGRVTIQFGCCYNYAVLKDGSPPGILRTKEVDPLPELFKVMIRRLVRWHVLPPTCVPDSCIVNIYEEGDCIPPHIDHHDFLRPFCTVSFLSECNIVFGSSLKVVGAGEFRGAVAIPLPLGSVLVINGNGADVAKHCVPAVPKKRISITFRKMDKSKRPIWFIPEHDMSRLEPLPYDFDETKSKHPPKSPPQIKRQPARRRVVEFQNAREFSARGIRSEPRYSGRTHLNPESNWKGLLPPPFDIAESETMNPQNVSPYMNRRPLGEKGRRFSDSGSRSEPRHSGQTSSQGSSTPRLRVRLDS